MFDRIPTPGQEGRMLITPESDDAPFHATIAMADNPAEEGTPLNKATLLKDATAALFGLDAAAVPDDVLAWLGKYNQHWWERTVLTALYGYKEVQTLRTTLAYLQSYRGNENIQYADSINIDQETGEITLINPSTMSFSYYNDVEYAEIEAKMNALLGKYMVGVLSGLYASEAISTVFYVPTDAVWRASYSADFGGYGSVYFEANSVYAVNSQLFNYEPGAKDVVWSTDRNAYPDSGLLDNFEYEYLGVPFANAVTAPKVEIGSYVGTGLYGAANLNKLTFSFAPRFVIVSRFTGAQFVYMFHRDSSSYSIGYSGSTVWSSFISEWDENTLTWYSDVDSSETSRGPTYQANQSGATYFYIAIG